MVWVSPCRPPTHTSASSCCLFLKFVNHPSYGKIHIWCSEWITCSMVAFHLYMCTLKLWMCMYTDSGSSTISPQCIRPDSICNVHVLCVVLLGMQLCVNMYMYNVRGYHHVHTRTCTCTCGICSLTVVCMYILSDFSLQYFMHVHGLHENMSHEQ